MSAREPVDKLLENEQTDPELRNKLQTLVDARSFAVTRLGLPENDSYSSYAATGKRYVTWNVVAAEEFSLKPYTWCFPVAGCVNYRGYFAEEDAKAYAQKMAEDNFDVTIGGASAYSTLGWFDDPILDTMLAGGDINYVGVLFHELAHQVLYVQDDSNFNEAFASFVQQQGIRIWLTERQEQARIERYDAHLKRSNDFSALLKKTQLALRKIYAGTESVDTKRQKKVQAFETMRADYAELKESWNGYSGYDGWFKRDLNNARLVSVATYQRFIPAFAALYEESSQSMSAFYELAKQVAALPPAERRKRLEQYL